MIKQKTQVKNKSKVNKKTKVNKTMQNGSGIFGTYPKSYNNLTYKGSNFRLPVLKCTVHGCNGKMFKHRILKINTVGKAILFDSDFFDNSFNSFTCVNCGFVQFYSRNTTYGKSMSGKSSKSSKLSK